MNREDFCVKRPYLYHLTDRANLGSILASRELMSTQAIAGMSMAEPQLKGFLSEKRDKHVTIKVGDREYKIRDQKPISLAVLKRSLSGNISAGEFIELLNNRVFWWPTAERLGRHYARYEGEGPIILKVQTSALFAINDSAEFCHLNSGATRCHPMYNGNAPTRGLESFVIVDNYVKSIGSVAEVTFRRLCYLPDVLWTSDNPSGPWIVVSNSK